MGKHGSIDVLRSHRKCSACDFSEPEEFPYSIIQDHHLEPKRRDGSDDPDNILPLCPTCHKIADGVTRLQDRGEVSKWKTPLIRRVQTIRRIKEVRYLAAGLSRTLSSKLAANVESTVLELIRNTNEVVGQNDHLRKMVDEFRLAVDAMNLSMKPQFYDNEHGKKIIKDICDQLTEAVKKLRPTFIEDENGNVICVKCRQWGHQVKRGSLGSICDKCDLLNVALTPENYISRRVERRPDGHASDQHQGQG